MTLIEEIPDDWRAALAIDASTFRRLVDELTAERASELGRGRG